MSTTIADDLPGSVIQSADDEKHLAHSKPAHPTPQADVQRGDTESLTTVEEQIALAEREGLNPAFYAKVQVLNAAIAETGMGRYQWELFISAGFGWMADNLWLQAIAIVMPAVANEFKPYPYVRLSTLALYAGLIVGATFWGMSCDVIGRRLAWNSTLFLSGAFGLITAGMPNYVSFNVMIALIGFAAGGNLPVDGTMFLEFLPGDKQYLLTFLSVWWAIGQCIGSLISWGFLAKYGCATPPAGTFCSRESNMGWRYSYLCLGALILFLWILRFFVLPVYESPKFLCSTGRDAAAVEVVHKVAKRNGRTSTLTLEDLQAAARPFLHGEGKLGDGTTKLTTWQLVKTSAKDLDSRHIKALFCTPRLAWSSSLIIFCYASLGLGYPLFNAFLGTYLQQKNAQNGDTSLDATYSAYAYQAACGVPGSVLAAFMVNWSRGGRKFAMAFFTIISGVFLFALTQARNSVQVNALICVGALFQNAFYGVLYGYAPEVFPTPSRGTGDALASAASRVTGIFAPVIAVYSAAADSPDGPVFAAAAIFVATGFVMLLLPIETRGKTAL